MSSCAFCADGPDKCPFRIDAALGLLQLHRAPPPFAPLTIETEVAAQDIMPSWMATRFSERMLAHALEPARVASLRAGARPPCSRRRTASSLAADASRIAIDRGWLRTNFRLGMVEATDLTNTLDDVTTLVATRGFVLRVSCGKMRLVPILRCEAWRSALRGSWNAEGNRAAHCTFDDFLWKIHTFGPAFYWHWVVKKSCYG